MDLTRQQVVEAAEHYAEVFDGYETEVEQLDRLPEAFEQGTWERADLEYIVEWKAIEPFVEKTLGDFRGNPDRRVEIVIEETLDLLPIVRKLERLRSLDGVGIPMATAILTFMNPQAYTVLDKNAWAVLRDSGHLYEDPSDSWESVDYLKYLGICHSLAAEIDIELRTLDRGLWEMGH